MGEGMRVCEDFQVINTLSRINERNRGSGEMNQIKTNRIEEITRLHNELTGLLMNSLEKAIKIGSLLEEQKKSLAHGKFIPWVEENLPFKERTARNYRRVYQNRNELKRQAVADLNTAYLVLEERRRLEKRRETEEKLRKSGQKIEYAREHPEEAGIGEVRYEKTKAGYTLKIITTGQINGLPITSAQCFDPEYIELEKNKASFEVSCPLGAAIGEIKGAVRNLKRIYIKYPGKIKSAYDHNWTDGKRDLYPELKRAYEELKKIMEFID